MIIDGKKVAANLRSELNSLNDQFELFEINNKNKIKKLFKSNKKKIDFRISPTTKNLSKFYTSIINRKLIEPNFFNARRIHVIIQKMVDSSKTKRKIFKLYLNKTLSPNHFLNFIKLQQSFYWR